MPKKELNKRQREIESVYKKLGIESEEGRRYLVGLGQVAGQPEERPRTVFIEAGTTSFATVESSNAGLERSAQ